MGGRRGDNPPRRRRRLQKRGEGNKKDKISLFSLLFPFVLRERGRRRAHGVQRMLVLWVLRAALRRRDQGREDQSGLCPVCVPLLLCFSPQLHFLLRADRRRPPLQYFCPHPLSANAHKAFWYSVQMSFPPPPPAVHPHSSSRHHFRFFSSAGSRKGGGRGEKGGEGEEKAGGASERRTGGVAK